jgi:hypothetical protein
MRSLTRRELMKSATAAVTFFTVSMGLALEEPPSESGAGQQALADTCSICEQVRSKGTVSDPACEAVGESGKSVAEEEPWRTGARAVTELGFVSTSNATYGKTETTPDQGVRTMLSQLHHQFDMLNWDSDFSPYKVLILADEQRLSDAHKEKVQSYLLGGGNLILSYQSGMDPEGQRFVLDQMGVKYIKPSPNFSDQGNYMEALGSFAEGFPAMPNFIFGSAFWVEPLAGTKVLARFWKPEFERAYEHLGAQAQNPEDEPTEFPAVTEHGNVIYLTFPAFTSFALHGNPVQRRTVKNCITRLLPEPLVRVDAPASAEVTVTEQGNRCIVHILNCTPEKQTPHAGIAEDVASLYDVKLALRLKSRPSRVYLAPQKIDLKFEYLKGYAELTVPEVHQRQMIVFES